MLNSNKEIVSKIDDILKKLNEYQLDCEKLNTILKTEEFKEDKKFNQEKIIYTILISIIFIFNLIFIFFMIKKKNLLR